MIAAEIIYQCPLCLRMHDDAGELLPFRFCVPVSQDCARADCMDAAKHQVLRDARAALDRAARLRARRERVQRPRAKGQSFVRSSCPRDTEPLAVEGPKANVQGPIFSGNEGERFAGARECEKEPLLDVETQCAALHDFLRKNFNQWFDNGFLTSQLKESLKVSNLHLNNIASKLRARLEDEGLALDVDSRAASPTVWEYRLCLKRDSVRLLRPNPERRATDEHG